MILAHDTDIGRPTRPRMGIQCSAVSADGAGMPLCRLRGTLLGFAFWDKQVLVRLEACGCPYDRAEHRAAPHPRAKP